MIGCRELLLNKVKVLLRNHESQSDYSVDQSKSGDVLNVAMTPGHIVM